MKTTLCLLLAAAIVIATGCSEKTSIACDCPAQDSVVTATVKYNQSANIEGCCNKNINVVFRSVKSDSRCPLNVQCVWAGTAIIVLQVDNHGDLVELEIHKPKIIQHSRIQYIFELTALTPYPVHGTTTDPNDYEATIKVTRK